MRIAAFLLVVLSFTLHSAFAGYDLVKERQPLIKAAGATEQASRQANDSLPVPPSPAEEETRDFGSEILDSVLESSCVGLSAPSRDLLHLPLAHDRWHIGHRPSPEPRPPRA